MGKFILIVFATLVVLIVAGGGTNWIGPSCWARAGAASSRARRISGGAARCRRSPAKSARKARIGNRMLDPRGWRRDVPEHEDAAARDDQHDQRREDDQNELSHARLILGKMCSDHCRSGGAAGWRSILAVC